MRLDTSRLINVRRQSDGSIVAQCPVCAEEGHDLSGKNHLRVWRSGKFNCLLHTGEKAHNRAIRAYLMNTALDDNPEEEYIDPEPTVIADKVYPEDTIKRLAPIYDYWVGRGARPDVLAELQGGMAPEDEKSKLSKRFIFPIRGPDGRITGFTGRLVEDNSFAPTWKHLFKSSRVCYPWHVTGAAIRASGTVVLVESVGDLLSLMSNDVRNVICLFGLNLNGKVISTLVANDVQRVVISLNRDEDPSKGQRAAERIADRLTTFFAPENVIIRLPPPPFKDWGQADEAAIQAFRAEIGAHPIS